MLHDDEDYLANPYSFSTASVFPWMGQLVERAKRTPLSPVEMVQTSVKVVTGEDYIRAQVELRLLPNLMTSLDELRAINGFERNCQAYTFCLAQMALSSPHALFALDELRSHKYVEVRNAAMLALLAIGETSWKIDPALLKFVVKTDALLAVPIRLYPLFIDSLHHLFIIYPKLLSALIANQKRDHESLGDIRCFEICALLARMGHIDTVVFKELTTHIYTGYGLGSNYKYPIVNTFGIKGGRATNALITCMQLNPSAVEMFCKLLMTRDKEWSQTEAWAEVWTIFNVLSKAVTSLSQCMAAQVTGLSDAEDKDYSIRFKLLGLLVKERYDEPSVQSLLKQLRASGGHLGEQAEFLMKRNAIPDGNDNQPLP